MMILTTDAHVLGVTEGEREGRSFSYGALQYYLIIKAVVLDRFKQTSILFPLTCPSRSLSFSFSLFSLSLALSSALLVFLHRSHVFSIFSFCPPPFSLLSSFPLLRYLLSPKYTMTHMSYNSMYHHARSSQQARDHDHIPKLLIILLSFSAAALDYGVM